MEKFKSFLIFLSVCLVVLFLTLYFKKYLVSLPSWLSTKLSADIRPLAGVFEVPAAIISPTKNPDGSWQVLIPANEFAVDSTLKVQKGQRVEIAATGQVNGCVNKNDAAYGWTGPEGWGFFWDQKRSRPLPYSPFMALGVKIGDGEWFEAGKGTIFTASQNGNLFFTVNDEIYDEANRFRLDWRRDNEGSFITNIKIG